MAEFDVRDLSDAEKTLIAEAIGEDPVSQFLVASVIFERAANRGLTPDEVVRQPKQFSGFERPDLNEFIARQPPEAIQQALAQFERARRNRQRGITNFLTTDLFESENRPTWADLLKVKRRSGGHVFLGR